MKYFKENLVLILALLLYLVVSVFLLGFVFPGALVLPQSFNLGYLTVHYYGICLAVGFLLGFGLLYSKKDLYNLNSKQYEGLIWYLLISGFVGARIYHVLSHADYYFYNLAEILKVWSGGLSIFGALLGGLIGLYIWNKNNSNTHSFTRLLDFLVPGLALAQSFGRLGNAFNYEYHGLPTSVPWAMFVPESFRYSDFFDYAFFHPLFYYESFVCLLLALILLKLPSYKIFEKYQKPGNLFAIYLILYSCFRIVFEYMRLDSTIIYGFKFNIITALVAIIIGILIIFRNYKYEFSQ